MARAHYWLPRGLCLVVFLYYALMAAPGFYWLDSAELSAGAAGLGVPHATGFPLYMMLGKLASLLPFGEIAFRINLLSGLCAGVAVGGLAKLVLNISRQDWAGFAGACTSAGVLAFTLLFVRQASIAEVYTPTTALIVITLLIYERVAQGGSASAGLSLAWIAGLGFGMHPSFRLLMGPPILALLLVRLYRGARWPLLTPAATSLSALCVYLYLPVRSATGRIAALDWGHANTLQKTLAHANASDIRETFAPQMMQPWDVAQHDFMSFATLIGDHLGLLCLLAAVIGLVVLCLERRTRWLAGAVASVLVIDTFYSVWINPMGLVDWQNGVPLTMAVALCAGVSVSALARQSGRGAVFVGPVAGLILILPPALVSIAAIGRVGDLPRSFSERMYMHAAPSAVVLTQMDSSAAGTMYLSTVEGARPDVAMLVATMLSDTKRVQDMLKQSSAQRSEGGVEDVLDSGRPVYWQLGRLPAPKPVNLSAFTSELASKNDMPPDLAAAIAEVHTLFLEEGHSEPIARRNLAEILNSLGRVAVRSSNLNLATKLFEAVLEMRPSDAAAKVNLGVVLSRQGDLEAALAMTQQALTDEPTRHGALINAARYELALGNVLAAQEHARLALLVDERRAKGWVVAALVDERLGDTERARVRLHKALELAPGLPEAKALLKSLD